MPPLQEDSTGGANSRTNQSTSKMKFTVRNVLSSSAFAPPYRVLLVQTLLSVFLLTQPSGTSGAISIRHGPQHQRVRVGTTVSFRCFAEISPASTTQHLFPVLTATNDATSAFSSDVVSIEWSKDGTVIASSRFRHPSGGGGASGGLSKSQTGSRASWVKDKGGHVTWKPDGRELSVANVTTADTGIYMCVVRHSNDMVTASAQLTVEDVPAAPIEVQIVSCDARVVQLQWRLVPDGDNNSPIIQYIVEQNTSFNPGIWQVAKTQPARDRYQRITLSPWGNYSFRVRAQNAVGVGPPSVPTPTQCQTPADVPHIHPRGVCTRNIRPRTLAVSWEPMPLEEQNAPGFHYVVKWRRHDLNPAATFDQQSVDPFSNLLVIDGQLVYKPYEIYVDAVNEMGAAVEPPRKVIGHSSEDIPNEIPQDFRLDPDKPITDRTADFLWKAVNTGPWRMQGFFRGYKIQFWKTDEGTQTMREHSIIYQEADKCWRDTDISTTSTAMTTTSQLVPSSSGVVRGVDRGGIRSGGSRHRRRREHEVNSAHIYNLWPYTNVTAHIVVLNAKYEGPPSTAIHFVTKEGVPGPVENLAVISRGSQQIRIGWDPPTEINGRLVGYTLTHRVVGTASNSANDEELVNLDDRTRLTLKGLTSHQTYRLTLCARTGAGRGKASYIDVRTLPSGPPVAPNFTATQIDHKSLNISWFTPPDGVPGTMFTVYYRRVGQGLPWSHSVHETERHWIVIDNLDPAVEYEMKVVAQNGDTDDSPKSDSRVRRVRAGLGPVPVQPTLLVFPSTVGTVNVGIEDLQQIGPGSSFYVQYRPAKGAVWQRTDSVSCNRQVSLINLDPRLRYEVRAVLQTDNLEFVSDSKFVVPGSNPGPDAQASVSGTDAIHRRPSVAINYSMKSSTTSFRTVYIVGLPFLTLTVNGIIDYVFYRCH